MDSEIKTPRFVLRPLEEDDLEELHGLWTEPRFRRFLWDGEEIPLDQTREVLEQNRSLFEGNGYGIWGVRGHERERLVGICGFWEFHQPPVLELLFGVSADEWNRGIATEVSRGVIRYGFESLGFGSIHGSCDAENAASIRVMEKSGLALQRREAAAGLDTVFYSITREAWERAG